MTPWWPAATYFTVFSAPAARSVTTFYPPPPATPPWASVSDVQVLYKAYWNFSLLLADATLGIHNPSFFNDTVAATSRALLALP